MHLILIKTIMRKIRYNLSFIYPKKLLSIMIQNANHFLLGNIVKHHNLQSASMCNKSTRQIKHHHKHEVCLENTRV